MVALAESDLHSNGFGFPWAQTRKEKGSGLVDVRLEKKKGRDSLMFGSPELDRTRLAIERVEPSSDGRSVDLITGPLVKGRVYLIRASGVRSAKGEKLVHPAGAYTLNEIPSERR